ncbi:collagen alpha-1(I) chain-like [Mesocricetus auratus]|uniref:Collagen alpha-1(I) chain-like n=1 Tax=Mesocricetus auratus TaxID=10036 RepID=A0ABM2X5R2_MESAU|nr:collagen alpha-1(I) chain-like [Mesocricetus auratus]
MPPPNIGDQELKNQETCSLRHIICSASCYLLLDTLNIASDRGGAERKKERKEPRALAQSQTGIQKDAGPAFGGCREKPLPLSSEASTSAFFREGSPRGPGRGSNQPLGRERSEGEGPVPAGQPREGGRSGAGGSEFTREGWKARSPGPPRAFQVAERGEAASSRLAASALNVARSPGASDAVDSLGLARLVLRAPWEQGAPGVTLEHQSRGRRSEIGFPGRRQLSGNEKPRPPRGKFKGKQETMERGTGNGKENYSPLLKDVQNFAPSSCNKAF